MSKDRVCHRHEDSALIQDILNVMYDTLRSLAKNTMVLSDTRNIIRDRIDISVWDVNFYEMRKEVK